MKYCMSCRQPDSILKKTDKIIVEERDWQIIPELFVKYPDKEVILKINNIGFPTKRILTLAQGGKIVFVFPLINMDQIRFLKEKNVRFASNKTITNFYEIRDLIELGVDYIKIAMPLTFYIKELSKMKMKFHMVPNIGFSKYSLRKNGLHGQWVRPEDVKFYEKGIDAFEFESDTLKKEETLFHIYKENQTWPGNLNLLITNLNIDIENFLLPENIGEKRSNCKQRCESSKNCQFCDSSIAYINALKNYKEKLDNKEKEAIKEDN